MQVRTTQSQLLQAASGKITWQLMNKQQLHTSSDKVLVVDAWVVHVMYNTCKYRSKYLQISEDILQDNKPLSQF